MSKCKNCIYAKWQTSNKTGRVLYTRNGQCLAPYILDDAPLSVSRAYGFNKAPYRNAIQWDTEGECPAFEAKGKS